jgi:hypothetical protein
VPTTFFGMKIKRAQVVSLFVNGFATILTVSSQALGREPVDPPTLNRPPPPEFNPVCKSTGNGTVSTVTFSDPPFARAPRPIHSLPGLSRSPPPARTSARPPVDSRSPIALGLLDRNGLPRFFRALHYPCIELPGSGTVIYTFRSLSDAILLS